MATGQGNAVVHFGMPKTGSTSLRASMVRALDDPGFHYVRLGGANASYALSTAFSANPGGFHVHVKRDTPPQELARLRHEAADHLVAELDAAGSRTALLSAEAVSGFDSAELGALQRVLAQHRAAVRFVGYVRRPKEYMESDFQQKIKAGGSRLRAEGLLPAYREMLEKFDAVAGRANSDMWLFDPERFPNRCVVQDFCARLGIRFRPEAVVRQNEGLSRPALSLLFAYRKYGPGFGSGPSVIEENRKLAGRLRKLAGPKVRLHSSLVAPLLAARRDDIAWAEARVGASLAEALEAHDEHAIRSEEDLLRFSPEALAWLARQLGPKFVQLWRPDMSPQLVAEWMHRLRQRISPGGGPVDAGEPQTKPAPRARALPSGPARTVIWIASYPKSGNTWLQAVIRNAGRPFGFPPKDVDVYKLIAEGREPVVVGGVLPAVTREATTVLKTHGRYGAGHELHPALKLKTVGFVHIMRNPLDLLLSYVNFTRIEYAKRQDAADYQHTLFVDLLGFERPIPYAQWVDTRLEDIPRANLDHALARFTELGTDIPTLRATRGSWLEHCRSWREAASDLPAVLLRYEDLLQGPEQFLPLKSLFAFSDERILRAAADVSEGQRGLLGKRVFFNKMSAYYYPDFFSPGPIGRFIDRFASELASLGYADLPRSADKP